MSRPLKRGRACMNCRFLKIKCDGQKPICGPCRKHPKNDDCEYSDGPARSRTKALEDAVSRLEVRLHELEHPEVSTPSMMLHDPCASTSLPQLTIFPLHPASRSLPNLPYHPQPQLLSPSNSLLKSLSSPLSPFSPHSPTGGSPPYQSRSPLPSPRGIFDTRTVSPNPSKPNVEQIQTLLESFHAYAEDPVLKCPTVPSEENNRERSIRKPTATSCSVCLLSNDHPLWNEAVHRTGIPSTFCRLPDQACQVSTNYRSQAYHWPVDPASIAASHSSTRILIYESLLSFLELASSTDPRMTSLLREHLESMSAEDSISALVKSRESRTTLLKLSSDLGAADDPKLRDALHEDERRLAAHIISILESESSKERVLKLDGDPAQYFLDVIQNALDRGLLLERDHKSKARRIILKLSEACDKLPSSLFITGVTGRDEHATFVGGFGDIYQASYGGKTVALKLVRTFHGRETRLKFCREALVWQDLQHSYILPLIGIDRESFPATLLCMVSPWMEHGTVLKYLSDHGRANVDRLLSEIAQGLEYLHSRNIVHGDLRGANILINDQWRACLADFGLTSFSDATTTALSSNRAGSVRWMAPELLDPSRFGHNQFSRTPASDIYAFGCVGLELYTGRPPFADISETAAMFRVIAGGQPLRPSCDPAISEALWQYLNECWTEDSAARPATHVVVRHMQLNYVDFQTRRSHPNVGL